MESLLHLTFSVDLFKSGSRAWVAQWVR